MSFGHESWDEGWPKLVKGICTRCEKEGSDFQIAKCPILCGDCKVEIGTEMIKEMVRKI